jgi:hypothetical protein
MGSRDSWKHFSFLSFSLHLSLPRLSQNLTLEFRAEVSRLGFTLSITEIALTLSGDDRFSQLAIWLKPSDYTNILDKAHRVADPLSSAGDEASSLLRCLSRNRIDMPLFWFQIFTVCVFCTAAGHDIFVRYKRVLSHCVDLTYGMSKALVQVGAVAHTIHHGRTMHSYFMMSARQTQNLFESIFRAIASRLKPDQHPGVIFSDECYAQMNALRLAFPFSAIRRCLFHLLMNIDRLFGQLQRIPEPIRVAFKKKFMKLHLSLCYDHSIIYDISFPTPPLRLVLVILRVSPSGLFRVIHVLFL